MRIEIMVMIILFCSCQNEHQKPMKYNRFGIEYSCTATYDQDMITSILCFTNSRDTLLQEYFDLSDSTGISKLFYESGEIKEIGTYYDNEVCGVWKEFYKNGSIKSFKYFKCDKDTALLFYQKLYLEDGALDKMMLPIEYRLNNEEKKIVVGRTYNLYIDLIYSEFDSVNSMLLIDSNAFSGVQSDTVFYAGRTGLISFTPKKEGKHYISGTYIEVNGDDPNPSESKVAEKPFKFEYEAVD